jgi:hypothetical protein
MEPAHGNTFLGLVIRYNESYESLSQLLTRPLMANTCYEFSLDLALTDSYKSHTPRSREFLETFVHPAVVRMWGGDEYCDRKELLLTSEPITNHQWQTYTFRMKPENQHRYFILEAYYDPSIQEPYNGHVLVDNISEIVPVECE